LPLSCDLEQAPHGGFSAPQSAGGCCSVNLGRCYQPLYSSRCSQNDQDRKLEVNVIITPHVSPVVNISEHSALCGYCCCPLTIAAASTSLPPCPVLQPHMEVAVAKPEGGCRSTVEQERIAAMQVWIETRRTETSRMEMVDSCGWAKTLLFGAR